MGKTAKPDSTFRDKLAELETITTQLEGDGVDLAEALQAFERGSQLVTELQRQLDDAELKIRQIQDRTKPAEDSVQSQV